MAANAVLKSVFTEDEKYHNLMSWLIYVLKYLRAVAFYVIACEL